MSADPEIADAQRWRATMAFTEEVIERQIEVDVGVGHAHVVEVARSERDLRALQDDVVALLQGEGIAIDQGGYAALWTQVGLTGKPPHVDFATEVVVWFGRAVSGSCNAIRLDDVVVDAAGGLVYPTVVLLGGERSCTSDAHPHAYVVALERDGLPTEFTVQLGPEVTCTGCEEARESETTPVTLDP